MLHPKDLPHQALPLNLHLGIVDFDSPIYRCAAVHEDDDEGLDDAKLTLLSFVQHNIVDPTRCAEYLFVVTGPDNFRHELAISKPYKGQRASEKPQHYMGLLEWAIERFNCMISEGVEADDLVINCQQKYQGSSVLIGMDKDNLQITGWHHNYVSGVSKHVTPFQAQWSLAYQMLAGDAGDNIPGLVGVGDKAARKHLDSDLPPMRVVYNVYKEKGLLGAYYTEQYRLLYMLRDEVLPFEDSFIELKATVEVEEVEDEESDDSVTALIDL